MSQWTFKSLTRNRILERYEPLQPSFLATLAQRLVPRLSTVKRLRDEIMPLSPLKDPAGLARACVMDTA